MKKNRFTLYRIVIIGLMAAMVFVCTMFLGIRIPTPTGTTQLKTANAICLLFLLALLFSLPNLVIAMVLMLLISGILEAIRMLADWKPERRI